MVNTTSSSSFSCYLLMIGKKASSAEASVTGQNILWLGMACSTNGSYPGFVHYFLTVVGLLDFRPCFELYNCLCVLECNHMHLYTELSKLDEPIITSLLVKKMSASYLLAVTFRCSM